MPTPPAPGSRGQHSPILGESLAGWLPAAPAGDGPNRGGRREPPPQGPTGPSGPAAGALGNASESRRGRKGGGNLAEDGLRGHRRLAPRAGEGEGCGPRGPWSSETSRCRKVKRSRQPQGEPTRTRSLCPSKLRSRPNSNSRSNKSRHKHSKRRVPLGPRPLRRRGPGLNRHRVRRRPTLQRRVLRLCLWFLLRGDPAGWGPVERPVRAGWQARGAVSNRHASSLGERDARACRVTLARAIAHGAKVTDHIARAVVDFTLQLHAFRACVPIGSFKGVVALARNKDFRPPGSRSARLQAAGPGRQGPRRWRSRWRRVERPTSCTYYQSLLRHPELSEGAPDGAQPML